MQQTHAVTRTTDRKVKVSSQARKNKYTNIVPDSHNTSKNDSLMDEMDSEVEPAFKTKNYVFELQSKCNNLAYEKTKVQMAHQNTLSELRHKNEYLQQIAGNLSLQNQQLSEENDNYKHLLIEVREQNDQFTKEVNYLKMQLELLQQTHLENQSTNSEDVDQSQVVELLNLKVREIQIKNQEISKLQKQLEHFTSSQRESISSKLQSPFNYKQAFLRVEKQRNELLEQLRQLNQKIKPQRDKESQQLVKLTLQNQYLSKQIHQKQTVILKLQHENSSLKAQVEKLKQNVEFIENKSTLGIKEQTKRIRQMLALKEEQLTQAQSQVLCLQQKVNQLQVEVHRLRCQKSGVQQYNKYLETNNLENEQKRRSMQQQIYFSEKKISELKAFIFNEKLANQKMISTLKLEFEEERIRSVEDGEQKQKQINRLKQIVLSNKKQNRDLEELALKVKSLSKVSEQNASLKVENQSLRQKLKNFQDKSQQKLIKEKLEDRQTRMQVQKRVQVLQKEINKLRMQNLQWRSTQKYSYQQLKILQASSSIQKKQNSVQISEFLKAEKKEKQQMAINFEQKIREKQQQIAKQNDTIRNLSNELREMKDHLFKNSMNEVKLEQKSRIIKDLQNYVSKLNDQLRKQKANFQNCQKELVEFREKHDRTIGEWEDRNKQLKRQISDLQVRIGSLQNELLKKDTMISVKQNEIRQFSTMIKQQRMENEMFKEKHKYSQMKKVEIQKKIIQVEKEKEKVVQELKKQLKLEREHRDNYKQISQREEAHNTTIERLKLVISKLQRENCILKGDYSNSLQEINHLLFNCRSLEQKFNKKQHNQDKMQQQDSDISQGNVRWQQLERQNDVNKLKIVNYQAQINRLNEMLMQKEVGHVLIRPQSQCGLHPKVMSRHSEQKLDNNYFIKKVQNSQKVNDAYTERTSKSFYINK